MVFFCLAHQEAILWQYEKKVIPYTCRGVLHHICSAAFADLSTFPFAAETPKLFQGSLGEEKGVAV